jgi:hypothetical protein
MDLNDRIAARRAELVEQEQAQKREEQIRVAEQRKAKREMRRSIATDLSIGVSKRVLPVLAKIAQWLVFGIAFLIGISTNRDIQIIDIPDAPVSLLICTVLIALTNCILLIPFVFWRLNRSMKIIAYGCLPLMFGFVVYENSMMQDAYVRSPEGIKAAADRESY